jgi:hypothetical protein
MGARNLAAESETTQSRIGIVEGALVRSTSQIARDSRKRDILTNITARARWSRTHDTPSSKPQHLAESGAVRVFISKRLLRVFLVRARYSL